MRNTDTLVSQNLVHSACCVCKAISHITGKQGGTLSQQFVSSAYVQLMTVAL